MVMNIRGKQHYGKLDRYIDIDMDIDIDTDDGIKQK